MLSQADSTSRRALEAELNRAIASSPWNGRAKMLLAPLTLLGDPGRARKLYLRALELDPEDTAAADSLDALISLKPH